MGYSPGVHLTLTRRLVTLSLTGAVLLPTYGAIGVYMAARGGPVHSLPTFIDRDVPFSAPWVVVYAMIFLQCLAPLFTITDARALNRTVGAYFTLYAFGTPVWMLYPVTVQRDPVPIVDIWTYGIGIVRYIDPPGNCMPSMHVALAVMATLVVYRHDREAGWALGLSAGLIWWSTLAIRQHYALDGLAGAAMAVVANWMWFEARPLPAEAYQRLPRAWHAAWVGLFVAAVLFLMSGWWLGWVPLDLLPPNARRW